MGDVWGLIPRGTERGLRSFKKPRHDANCMLKVSFWFLVRKGLQGSRRGLQETWERVTYRP